MSDLPEDAGVQTLAVHAGEAPDEITGASSNRLALLDPYRPNRFAA